MSQDHKDFRLGICRKLGFFQTIHSVSEFRLLVKPKQKAARIKVGVGGGRQSPVIHDSEGGFDGVEFVAVNTDAQRFFITAPHQSEIGETSRRTGSGGDPEYEAAAENRASGSRKSVRADMVFFNLRRRRRTVPVLPCGAEVAKESEP
jgi:cell division GTPase FtsZ